ncbi:NAD binding domain of 6-phosphogluconate dehydrogenase [Blastococcus mobilis]|uniref:NAD binding domain of 6-phosphogluconate dehydrogenase n=1 Tax=Blastococcus mobilis TaxID=1938746 RepID=A0A238UTF4_9ACTN|nr:NAD binding domain of 6-phosphogluconate dehydrogenase [Blastococcus mobilis]
MRIGSIGVIGLGDTGSAVARRLLAQGFEVTVHDRDACKMAALVEAGATAARIPADAAEPADLVFVHLPDDSAAEEVLFDCGGVGETLPDDGLVVATFATEPVFVLSAAARLASLGLNIMEAWFLGDEPSTATTALAAGAPEHLATVTPVLEAIGVDLARVGPLGSVAALRTTLAAVRPPAGKALSPAAGTPVDVGRGRAPRQKDPRRETTMDSTLFDRLCDELGYEPSTVRVIRVTAREVGVTYTEPSGMPAGSTHPLQGEVDEAA